MARSSSGEVSRLLQAWNVGDETALEKLMPLVYKELHRMARFYMARESPGHTLQTTALVNTRRPPACLGVGTSGYTNFDEQLGESSVPRRSLYGSGKVGPGNAGAPPACLGAGTSRDPEVDEQPGVCSVPRRSLRGSGEVGSGSVRPPPPCAGTGTS